MSGLDFEFTAEKTLKPEPNTCAVQIYNLSENTRKTFSNAKKLTLRLEAGYQGAVSQIYLGEVRNAWTERSGADFITHIESGDKEKEIAQSGLHITHGAKVPTDVALKALVGALGVNPGNLQTLISKGAVTRKIKTVSGSALTGNAARRLTDICRSAGLEWSIQDGSIQILETGATLNKTAIQVSAATGMIDSPTVDNEGIVSASMLITPGLLPGNLVVFDSLFVKGGYRIQRCSWKGQTFGNEWRCDFECKKF